MVWTGASSDRLLPNHVVDLLLGGLVVQIQQIILQLLHCDLAATTLIERREYLSDALMHEQATVSLMIRGLNSTRSRQIT